MGLRPSNLSKDEIEDLLSSTNFTQRELIRLYKRYRQLDKKGEGVLTEESFLVIPELAVNPLQPRIFQVFDSDHTGRVSFNQFVRTLSCFSKRASTHEKLDLLFRIYDREGKGISRADLVAVLHLILGAHLTDSQVANIVEQTFAETDEDEDGQIGFEEFERMLGDSECLQKMVINFS